jgi:methyl-accepting chemotaxis protein
MVRGMLEPMSTEELLDAWRDATRAAELAERLATAALRAVERADQDAATAQELATLAEDAATSAERAAEAARQAARRAVEAAAEMRDDQASADASVTETRLTESDARSRYHDAGQGAAPLHERPLRPAAQGRQRPGD